ncbi:hypothetical protein [Pseudodesulfovibrio alkaliphilus]|nr:hypothetical protein [Pseudodesulfovibrio alkaliphilus]
MWETLNLDLSAEAIHIGSCAGALGAALSGLDQAHTRFSLPGQ